MRTDHAELEEQLAQRLSRDDRDGAATVVIEVFGPQVMGFMNARLGALDAAEEAFTLFAEDVWRGLPGFSGRGSLRGWVYTLARNAANRHGRRRAAARKHEAPMPSGFALQAAAEVRTRTRPYLRTDVKDEFRSLREQLSEEDQTLLILRVDRDMEWNEIAQVLGDDEALDSAQTARVAARMRQRFQAIKGRLRQLADEAGLLD